MKRNDSLIKYFKKRKKKVSLFLGVAFIISILVLLSESKFIQIIDEFRSPHLWTKENGDWKLKHTCYN